MIRSRSLWIATLVWLLAAATLVAKSNPLAVIPDSALGFAVIADLGEANRKLAKVTEKMQFPIPDVLMLVSGYFGVQQGLDEHGGLAIALVPGPEGREWEESGLVFVVPVEDYQRFVAAFGPDDPDAAIAEVEVAGYEMVVARKADFAVFAFAERKANLEALLDSTDDVTDQIEPLKVWMADKQLALVVTPAGKQLLFESLAAAFPDTAQLKKDAGAGGENAQAEALGNVGEMFGGLRELMKAADEQMTHFAVGLHIDDTAAMRLAARALFVKDGQLAAWSKEVKVPSQGLLAGLPAGKFALAYGGVSADFSPETAVLLRQFTEASMQLIGLDEESRKQYDELSQKVTAGKRFTSGMMGIMRPGDTLYSTALAVEHVAAADAHFQAMQQMFELMESRLKNPQSGEPLYELSEVNVGELEALELVTHLGAAANLGANLQGGANPAAPNLQGMFDKLFGGDGAIHMYVAQADDKTVVTAYSKEQLAAAVKHVRSGAEGLAADADLTKTAAMLPTGAQWVAYVSPQGLIQWASVLVEAMAGGEIRLPPFAATEPIGLAAKVSETGLDAELVLPESVVAGIGRYIVVLGQLIGQGGGAPLP